MKKKKQSDFSWTILMFDFSLSFAFCSHFELANWERHNFILCLNDVGCPSEIATLQVQMKMQKGVEYMLRSQKMTKYYV